MPSPRTLPTRKSLTQKETKLFDPKVFFENVCIGTTVRRYRPKQAIFSQGDLADAVFYIREGKVKFAVVSKQGKEATIALLGPGDFLARPASPRINPPPGNRYTNYGLLYSKDRKEADAVRAPRGTRVLRHLC